MSETISGCVVYCVWETFCEHPFEERLVGVFSSLAMLHARRHDRITQRRSRIQVVELDSDDGDEIALVVDGR